MSCGPTETLFGNKIAETVGGLYKIGPDAGAAAVAMRQLPTLRGGCGCMGGKPPKNTLRGGYGGCTGQPMMLKALGIMNGGKRRATIRKRGGYKPTAKDRAALRKFRAGKSIGFTMRSSLKAKGLIPRANGTRRVSNKYK